MSGLTFDWTINLGQLATALAFVGTVIYGAGRLVASVAANQKANIDDRAKLRNDLADHRYETEKRFAEMKANNAQLFEELKRELREIRGVFLQSRAIELRDDRKRY